MRILPLRKRDHPDLSDFVVHFTAGGAANSYVPHDIRSVDGLTRLTWILRDGLIRGFPVFSVPDPVVCFTECTRAGMEYLFSQRRYEPYGIGFSKDTIFARGGGPALYVRGDEWQHANSLPAPLRSRLVRLWPGAEPEPGESLSPDLSRESDWLLEREWRIPAVGDPPGFRFRAEDVAFVIVKDPEHGEPWPEIYFFDEEYNMTPEDEEVVRQSMKLRG